MSLPKQDCQEEVLSCLNELVKCVGIAARGKVIPYAEPRPTWRIYFLVNDAGEIVYIGKTSNLKKRVCDHRRNFKGKFSHVFYIRADSALVGWGEAMLIARAKPKLNVKSIEIDYPDTLEKYFEKLWGPRPEKAVSK